MKLSTVIFGLLTSLIFSGVGLANTPAQLVQPVVRPDSIEQEIRPEFAVFMTNAPGLKRSLRPQARPVSAAKIIPRPVRVVQIASSVSLKRSLRPQVRPENLRRKNTVVAAGFEPTTQP